MEKSRFSGSNRVVLIVVALLGFGIIGVLAPSRTLAAPVSSGQAVGYVNQQQVFASYPGIQDILSRIQAMRTEAQKDYDEHTKDLLPAEKKAYSDKIAQQEARREDELMKPIGDKIAAAIAAVTREKGLTVVLDAGIVVYGGIDITADVIAKVKQ